jgi:hypothetical protein
MLSTSSVEIDARVLMRQMTKRYLAMEAQGLKDRSEGLWKLRGSNA